MNAIPEKTLAKKIMLADMYDSNLDYDSVMGGGHMAEARNAIFQELCAAWGFTVKEIEDEWNYQQNPDNFNCVINL